MTVLIFVLGLLAGCSTFQHIGAGRDAAESQMAAGACEPAIYSLSKSATLSDRAGQYRLTLVEVVGNAPKRSATGSLSLRPREQNHDSMNEMSTPLHGFTDVDLPAVGAYRVGDPGSRDPQAPGVLVLERDNYGNRVIILRLGSDANRSDLVRYDGAYMVLEVQRIEADRFVGSWRSGLPMARTRTTGYFCAERIP